MRRLIAWSMMSPLDGYFEGPKLWELDGHEYLDPAREAGALLFGRRTYEGMLRYWSAATGEVAQFMNLVPKVVFSNTLATVDWSHTRLVRGSAADEVARLKQRPGKDLFLFGSASLAGSLTREGLIDEYRIGLNPLAPGREMPEFKPSDGGVRLELAEARPTKSGVVLLRYARA